MLQTMLVVSDASVPIFDMFVIDTDCKYVFF